MHTRPYFHRQRPQRGVTLLELMIAISLTIILAAIATPYFRDMAGRYRLNAAASRTAGLIKLARVVAVTRNTQVRLFVKEYEAVVANNSTTKGKGAYWLEYLNTTGSGLRWRAVEPVPGPGNLDLKPATASCKVGSDNIGSCLDLVTEYPGISLNLEGNVGLDAIDATGPALVYGPDGFILNNSADFDLGISKQELRLVLYNKRGTGLVEARILWVDRAGAVRIERWRGKASQIPS